MPSIKNAKSNFTDLSEGMLEQSTDLVKDGKLM
jgi:hypothetical protein